MWRQALSATKWSEICIIEGLHMADKDFVVCNAKGGVVHLGVAWHISHGKLHATGGIRHVPR